MLKENSFKYMQEIVNINSLILGTQNVATNELLPNCSIGSISSYFLSSLASLKSRPGFSSSNLKH